MPPSCSATSLTTTTRTLGPSVCKLETHPKTGAAQFVEVREAVQEAVHPLYVQPEPAHAPKPHLFEGVAERELLGYGVPPEWLADVLGADEDTILDIAAHLPEEASEALLELATGGTPRTTQPAAVGADPFEHPDAQRRFRVVTNVEELERALEFPWEKWTVFLHPDQREWVERDYNGPARVSGSAGTGKTVVALHRAAYLARSNPEARVLLTTFSDTLAETLHTKLRVLLVAGPHLAERVDVVSLDAIGLRLHKSLVGPAKIADRQTVRDIVARSGLAVEGHRFTPHFLMAEWEQVVDAWQLQCWESYRDVARLGRRTRLLEPQRRALWSIFERIRAELRAGGLVTMPEVFGSVATAIRGTGKPIFDFAVVDESQDIGVPHLRFLTALGGDRPGALFFAGDLGQRIFQQPFSWKSLGVDIRGRSRTLRVNYRTSHQIRTQADRLLGPVVTDVDGNAEDRSDTVSVFNGPPPTIRAFAGEAEEIGAVATWVAERVAEGVSPNEFGVFVRSAAQFERARAAVEKAGLVPNVLDEHVRTIAGRVSIGTMHLAKGLEFRAVVVMACDDEVMPLQDRIETVGDDADLQEVYDTERQLLYVACTRARDHLLVTCVEPGSEFLDDMRA